MTKKKAKRLTKKQKRMQRAMKRMSEYAATYESQEGCVNYSDQMFIDDMLYGIGIALDDKYQFSDGWAAFQDVLREHLSDTQQ
jgi:hypothetical protein